jgi:transketolase C-terminal domain/subunit
MLASHAYHSPGPHGLKELAVSLLQFPIDDEAALSVFPHIKIFKPKDEAELSSMWQDYLYNDQPCYLNILRKA